MARVCPLYSGSSGNSTYIASGSGGLLVDAGTSCKRIMLALGDLHIDPSTIRGVFVTHEHVDHISGLRVFLQRTKATLFASEAVLSYLCTGGHVPAGAAVEAVQAGEAFGFDDVSVTGFATSHDSVGSLGYRFELSDGRVASVATDLGCVSESLEKALAGSDLVVLEANYDPVMLAGGPYPYVLKRRIMGERGHLANGDSAKLAAKLVRGGTTRLILAHLSAENNRPDVAQNTICRHLDREGMGLDLDYTLSVAPRSQPGRMTVF